jgi:hypothetical protein
MIGYQFPTVDGAPLYAEFIGIITTDLDLDAFAKAREEYTALTS